MTDRLCPGDIADLLPRLDAAKFDLQVYQRTGLFVVRHALPGDEVEAWRAGWRDFSERVLGDARQVNPFNPVVVNEPLPPSLAHIYRCGALLDLAELLYPDLALYMQRVLVKDRHSRAGVFVHNDVGYDLGWPEKTSVFVPLSEVTAGNGGLVFYPGTHALGYLGDAGELNPEVLDATWPRVSPTLAPGDIVLMHECTWHASEPHVGGVNRVLVQITYQPASDPSGTELLRGEWRTPFRLTDTLRAQLFTRSRASRLRELQAQVDQLRRQGGSSSSNT